jgi:ABC-type transport system substrate-binding protein
VAAVREPPAILPPLVQETVGRDIGDRVFERLATMVPGGATIDAESFRPALAERWERVDPLTWRFALRPEARWHDGRPVTADDVVFSFDSYADTALGAMAGSALEGVRALAPWTTRPSAHPVLGDRELRKALTLATDRAGLARALVGEGAMVPVGPMSRLLWIAGEGASGGGRYPAAVVQQIGPGGTPGEWRAKAGRRCRSTSSCHRPARCASATPGAAGRWRRSVSRCR